MKLTTVALAAALTLTSTFALAQTSGTEGYGSVVAPSMGSYPTSVGSTNQVPTWRNTGPATHLSRRRTSSLNALPSSTAPTVGLRR